MHTGSANLPLHGGKAPRWLFDRMVKLAREITIAIVTEYGPEEMLQRISHPYWFQSLGCVLGFDWHSSGVTTTTTGALKMGIAGLENDLGLWIAGGKGGTSRKTPSEIETVGLTLGKDLSNLVYASKMSAKVDSAALQDTFQLYHHNFFFTKEGNWAVIQQGMNTENKWARRYHWLSDSFEDFVADPHSAVASDQKLPVLNMATGDSAAAQKISTLVAKEKPEKTARNFEKLLTLNMPARFAVTDKDIRPENLKKTLLSTYENQPANFEELLVTPGVGPKTIRALAMLSEIVYNAPASRRDPVKYTFAHGGKDGTPYPVDRETYDKSIEILRTAVRRAKIGEYDKLNAFKRLQTSLF